MYLFVTLFVLYLACRLNSIVNLFVFTVAIITLNYLLFLSSLCGGLFVVSYKSRHMRDVIEPISLNLTDFIWVMLHYCSVNDPVSFLVSGAFVPLAMLTWHHLCGCRSNMNASTYWYKRSLWRCTARYTRLLK